VDVVVVSAFLFPPTPPDPNPPPLHPALLVVSCVGCIRSVNMCLKWICEGEAGSRKEVDITKMLQKCTAAVTRAEATLKLKELKTLLRWRGPLGERLPIPVERYTSLQPVVVAIYVKEHNARMRWGPTRTAWVVAVMRGVHRRSLLVAIAKLDS
jgi:hypothetical protein